MSPPSVGPQGDKLRAVVVSQGGGIDPPLVERFHEEFRVVEVINSTLPLAYRLFFLLTSFRLSRAQWRREWYRRREKIPLAFRAITRTNARRLAALRDQCDLVLYFGALHSTGLAIHRPLYIITDSTRALSSRNPYDVQCRFTSASQAARWMELEAEHYRQARRIFVGSQFVRNSLIQDYGIAPEKVIATGFGGGLMHAERYTKHFDGRTILFIGKGDFEKKGGLVLLEALSRVRREIPEAVLHVVGPRSIPITPGAVSHGFVTDRAVLRDLMQEAHVFVLPSFVDRNPLTLLEAMAAATPCIATDYGAMPEIVGDAGLVVARGDVGGLAHALLTILRDAELASELGRRGRRRFEERYNWDMIWPIMRREILTSLGE